MLHADDVEAGDQADVVGQVEADERRVRVVHRRVDDDVRERAADRAKELPDLLPGRRLGGRIGRRAVAPQVVAELAPLRADLVAGASLAEEHEVHDVGRGLRPEVGEDVAHVEVEVDDRGVLAGDLGDRGGEVRGEKRLAGAALGGEHRDDPAALVRRELLAHVGGPKVLRPGDRPLDRVAKLLAPLRQVDDVADAGPHRGGQESVPGVVAHHDDGGSRRGATDELGEAEGVRLLYLGGEHEDVDGRVAVDQRLLGGGGALNPADPVGLHLERPRERLAKRLRRADRVDAWVAHGPTILPRIFETSMGPSFGGLSPGPDEPEPHLARVLREHQLLALLLGELERHELLGAHFVGALRRARRRVRIRDRRRDVEDASVGNDHGGLVIEHAGPAEVAEVGVERDVVSGLEPLPEHLLGGQTHRDGLVALLQAEDAARQLLLRARQAAERDLLTREDRDGGGAVAKLCDARHGPLDHRVGRERLRRERSLIGQRVQIGTRRDIGGRNEDGRELATRLGLLLDVAHVQEHTRRRKKCQDERARHDQTS